MSISIPRHEYTWSDHSLTGNGLGWGLVATSSPGKRDTIREMEKIAAGLDVDTRHRVPVEMLLYSKAAGFVRAWGIPCESGKDGRQNKNVRLYQMGTEPDPGLYLAPLPEWEEARGQDLAPADLDPPSEEELIPLIWKSRLSEKIGRLVRLAYRSMLGETSGINLVCESWKREEFEENARIVMSFIHRMLPAALRRKAGYISFTDQQVGGVAFSFSAAPAGENHFLFEEEDRDIHADEGELENLFFEKLADGYLTKDQAFHDFLDEANSYLETSRSLDETLPKLQWIFYKTYRDRGGQALSFATLCQSYPRLLYWTSREPALAPVALAVRSDLDGYMDQDENRTAFMEALITGMTRRTGPAIATEISGILQDYFDKDKERFLKELAGIRGKNRELYTLLLSVSWRDERVSPSYDEVLLEENSDTMNTLYLYVSDMKAEAIPDDMKDEVLRDGIHLLNQNLFDRNQYDLFDALCTFLDRKKQWTGILEDLVSQFEHYAKQLDPSQKETALYADRLLHEYRPDHPSLLKSLLSEENEQVQEDRKEEDKKEEKDTEEMQEQETKEQAVTEKEPDLAETREITDEEPMLPFFLTSIPQGFLTGCCLFLMRYSFKIGHWKIALGLTGMWVLIMLNYQFLLLHRKANHPVWKVLGICLIEGLVIEIIAWFFPTQQIRIFYFGILGIATIIMQVINILSLGRDRISRREYE